MNSIACIFVSLPVPVLGLLGYRKKWARLEPLPSDPQQR